MPLSQMSLILYVLIVTLSEFRIEGSACLRSQVSAGGAQCVLVFCDRMLPVKAVRVPPSAGAEQRRGWLRRGEL